MPRYVLRLEWDDSTLSDPFPNGFSRKADALRVARSVARRGGIAVRIWVDDTTTDCGVASFPMRREA